MSGFEAQRHPASFRDPHGHILETGGTIFRAVEPMGEPDYKHFVSAGLYGDLVDAGLLIPHEDLGVGGLPGYAGCRVLKPERVPVISYACEWTFSQLREAALLTLDIQALALKRGFSLRDASSFNVQFRGTRPVFIDTLSFACASGEAPWRAYRQFCQHFLCPLALIAHRGHAIWTSWSPSVDGIDLRATSALLPRSSWFQPGLFLHIHLHAKAVSRTTGLNTSPEERRAWPGFGLRLVASLRSAVRSLLPRRAEASHWTNYRNSNTYTANDAAAKTDFVRECVDTIRPLRAIDLGANDGLYTSLLAKCGVPVTAVDSDAQSCEAVFNGRARECPELINTARIDLANPTSSFGWASEERSGFVTRFQCDLVLALALVHHLAIEKQIPLSAIAKWLASLGPDLVVEYVPSTDPMAVRLLAARPGGRPDSAFSKTAFLEAFQTYFVVLRASTALANGRLIFWMRRRSVSA